MTVRTIAETARAAALSPAATTAQKNAWLRACADRLESQAASILAINAIDVHDAPARGLNAAAVDRLTLTPARIRGMIESLRQVAELPDPVGVVLEHTVRPNGLNVSKVVCPIGVILFLYESRPNVTADAAAICIKSGNAVILRGGKECLRTNVALHEVFASELPKFGMSRDHLQLVTSPDREVVGELLTMDDCIDLVIPRGGESLIRRVAEEARMPVLKHYRGNCHVYVDDAADLTMAEQIVINAKTHRPGVCNAAESLLVHTAVAKQFLPTLAAVMPKVEFRGCERTQELIAAKAATEDDYYAEFLDLILSVRVVDSLEAAIDHINRYGSKHTEAIITANPEHAKTFMARVDAAAVVVNASTRFNDGYELGLGAEIGISTDKFHARGPCGLRELTTYKWIIQGYGQIRT